MQGVLVGFAVIAAVIGAGFITAHLGIVGADAERVLSRLAFFVLTPALLFSVIANADIGVLFTALLPVSALAAVSAMAVYAIVALLIWRRAVPETVIGSLGAGLVNANNIGLPISAYVLGDPATAAPIMMFQLIVLTPIALVILDNTTGRPGHPVILLVQSLRNPLIIASVLGLVVALTGISLPDSVFAPFDLIGGAAVPVVLLAFGMSLNGARVLAPGTGRRDVVLASALKLAVMPVVAWVLARFVFGLDGHAMFSAVVLAALPSAQNVFTFAQRYQRGTIIARDTVLITTLVSLPVLLLVAAFLAA